MNHMQRIWSIGQEDTGNTVTHHMKALKILCWMLLSLLPAGAKSQCFGTEQFPANTTVPDAVGALTVISPVSFAGDYALVTLTAGHSYRFSSSVATDHITVSTALASGAEAFGTQPLLYTASASQTHFVHFHTNASCGTQTLVRTTRVQRMYCAAGTSNCGGTDEAITRVTIGAINNVSGGCGGGGYTDFSDQVTGVFTGQAVPVTVVNANGFAGDQVRAFVDWNRDLEFGDANGEFILATSDNLTFTGNITAPPGTLPGNVRMRVRLTFTGAVPACGNTTYGEVEDYTLNVGTFGAGVYAGGNGRGDVLAAIQPAAIVSNIYSGGNGRGDVLAAILPAPIASNIYSGGNGRGDVLATILTTPIASNIYSGGNGRGDVFTAILPTPIASNIYSGGNGRGDVLAAIQPTPIFSNIYSGGNGRGDVMISFDPRQVLLALKGMLEGPYSPSTGLMGDALRVLPSFPLTEPYTALGYAHTGGGGGENVAPAVLAISGNNAIVDWVVVELRDAFVPTTVLATRSALVQRDGDVVTVDGVSPVSFTVPAGSYNVALRHRNHLGVMENGSVALSSTATAVDLSNVATSTFGTNARKSITGTFPTQALWAGDVTFNGQVKYTGSGNDRDPILTTVGSTTPNNSVNLYSTRDVNLNGQVKYTGSGNDRDPILVNAGSTTPNNVRTQQLP